MKTNVLRSFFVGSLVLIALPMAARAQWPEIALAPYVGKFSLPVQMTHAGDGSGRLFFVEQGGVVKIVKNGTIQAVSFLDITNRVLSGGERGLLSIAFPPLYAAKGHFYVNYTRNPDGATVVSRFTVGGNPDIAAPGTEEILLIIDQPFPNHNGGQLAFSPEDGYLYIGMGDGGSGGDPENYAQNLMDLPGNKELLGKLLRINVESGAIPYAIPSDNPAIQGNQSEIWALGLRNPWRFSFDQLTGDLYIGDVGQNSWEEINFQPASSQGGENYGWRILEGSQCFNPLTGCIAPPNNSLPVAEYAHSEGCSVTGGFVYRGGEFPLMDGIYLYGDFCSGKIWGLRQFAGRWETSLLLDTSLTISSFGEGEDRSLYVIDYAQGDIYRIVGPTGRNISISPSSLDFGNVVVGQSSELSFTITNEATSTETLTGDVGILSAPFSVVSVSGGDPFSLTPGQSTSVAVLFSPTAAGPSSANLFIPHNATNQFSPANIPLAGTGVIILLPDLVISPFDGPGAALIRKKITITFAVQNQGTAAAGPFKMNFHLSTDNAITPEDRLLGSLSFSQGLPVGGILAPPAGGPFSASITLPRDAVPGPYFMGAIVDSENGVAESDESNNTDSFAIALCISLSKPSLLSPAKRAKISTTPTLDWSDVSGAPSYEVQVATDSKFSNVVAAQTGLTASEWTVTPALGGSTTLFWRVRAISPCGPGPYSAKRRFEITQP